MAFENAENFSQWMITEKLISTVPWDDAGAYVRFSVTFIAKDQADEQRVLGEIDKRLASSRSSSDCNPFSKAPLQVRRRRQGRQEENLSSISCALGVLGELGARRLRSGPVVEGSVPPCLRSSPRQTDHAYRV